MPRAAKPPHLVYIKPKYTEGKLAARGYWAIKHRTKLVSTGCSLEQRDEAEGKRLEYEVALYAAQPTADIVAEHGRGVRDVLVVDLIAFYVQRREAWIEAKTRDRKRDYLNTVERLLRFWDGKTVYDINERSIKAYQATARVGSPLSNNHTRREMQDLKAMVLYGIAKNLCDLNGHVIDWELPSPPEPRTEFYTRSEIAKLVWTAWKAKNMAMGRNGVHTSRHLARFILIGVGTGTRSEKIERASYVNTVDLPWMDLESGIFYRAGVSNKSPLNKRADPVRIPDDLLAHLRRWRAKNPKTDNVIDHNGKSGSTRRAFHSLKKQVFDEGRAKVVNRHTLKHTCASWLMASRVRIEIIAAYLSTTEEVIKKHYGHFSPDFHSEINNALNTGRQARREKLVQKRAAGKSAVA
jgi:integrase